MQRRQLTWEDVLTVEDFILAALYYAGGKLPTKTHLMKILAAYATLTGKEKAFEYTPYHMGLYSVEVEASLQNLIDHRLVERTRGYRLTNPGWREAQRAAKLIETYLPDEAPLLRSLSRQIRGLKTEEVLLLHYVLFCNEDCRARSKKWKELEQRRLQIALDMLRRRRASWRLAARLAGVEPERFLDIARKHGVNAGDELRLDDIEAAERDADIIRARLRRRNNG